MSNVHRACLALTLVAGVVSHAGAARADAIADQKQAYKTLGIKPHVDDKCTIFTKSDAERVLKAPVVHVATAMDPTSCAYGLATDPGVGVIVSRSTPPIYPPHEGTAGVSKIRHVKGVGMDAYTYYANEGAGGVYTADVLTSKGVTSVSLPEKAGDAAKALSIARMVMNR